MRLQTMRLQTDQQAPTGSQTPAPTTTETVAKRPELQSGETLLVEAYVAIWAITFLFIFAAWRRTRSLEEKLAAIEGGLQKARAAHEKAEGAVRDGPAFTKERAAPAEDA